jgi:CRP/FNR family transcriptional regulator, cyclic AMP receptor protein
MSKALDELEAGASIAARAYRNRDPSSRTVRLLEVDPDLGAGIAPEHRSLAVSRALAAMLAFERGPWRFRPRDAAGLGALILEGMILVRVEFAGIRANVELLGEGDVISPWQGMGAHPTAPCAVTTRVISNVRIALLDRGFTQRTALWPEIHSALMQRLLGRARMLSMQSAINSLPRIEERLEITLWQLAYRFGRVTPDGIRLHLPLSHSQLAEIVCARRPSVSSAISRLREQGALVLTARHQWLLRGDPPARLAAAGGDATGI